MYCRCQYNSQCAQEKMDSMYVTRASVAHFGILIQTVLEDTNVILQTSWLFHKQVTRQRISQPHYTRHQSCKERNVSNHHHHSYYKKKNKSCISASTSSGVIMYYTHSTQKTTTQNKSNTKEKKRKHTKTNISTHNNVYTYNTVTASQSVTHARRC